MARFVIGVEYSVPGSTTKTITVFPPAGFRIVSGGYDLSAGTGDLSVIASVPVANGKYLNGYQVNNSNVDFADGTTPDPAEEGWKFKVANANGSSRTFVARVLVEEGVTPLFEITDDGGYPGVSIV